MNNQSLHAIEITCWAIAACFGIAGAWLKMRDAYQSDEAREVTRQWYGHKWQALRKTSLLRFPEAVVEWLLLGRITLGQRAVASLKRRSNLFFGTVSFTLAFACTVSVSILLGWRIGGSGVAITYVAWFCLAMARKEGMYIAPESVRHSLNSLLVLAYLVGIVCWLKLLLGLPTLLAALVMLALLPLYAVGLGVVVGIAGGITKTVRTDAAFDADVGSLLGITMAMSFCVTLCALLIGHAILPDAHVPQTLQMLFSNVICDGLTMLGTFLILGAAVGLNRKLSIPLAIILDVALAGALACASLWWGLAWTEHALSMPQVFSVLIFQNPTGVAFELSPCFWAMHTTFLPTLAYLSIIGLCWLGKIVVLPLANRFRLLSTTDKPHNASAATLLFVAGIFYVLAKALAYCQ